MYAPDFFVGSAPTLAHACQLNPLEGVHRARALMGEVHNQDAHLSVYFVNPIRHLELPFSPTQRLFPLAMCHRQNRLDWANTGHV